MPVVRPVRNIPPSLKIVGVVVAVLVGFAIINAIVTGPDPKGSDLPATSSAGSQADGVQALASSLSVTSTPQAPPAKWVPTDSPEERARTALNGFSADMLGETARLSRVTGDMTYKQGSAAASKYVDADDELGVQWEWGNNPSVHFSLKPTTGSFSYEAYCFRDYKYVKYLSSTYQTRTYTEDQDCSGIRNVDDLGDEHPTFLFVTGTFGAELVNVTELEDHSVRAYFETPQGAYTIVADATARLRSMEFDDEEASGLVTADYATRTSLTRPSYATKSSAHIGEEVHDDGSRITWTALDVPQPVRISDLEVRVQQYSNYTWTTLWVFQLTGPGEQARGNWQFSSSLSGGPNVVPGDTFTVTSPDAQDSNVRVVVWDRWAEEPINSNPMPGPGPLVLLGAIGAIALLQRRRLLGNR